MRAATVIRDDDHSDDRSPAMGVFNGVVIGALFWGVIAFCAFIFVPVFVDAVPLILADSIQAWKELLNG